MKEQIITLRVRCEGHQDDPANWDWQQLMDCGPYEEIEVISSSPAIKVEPPDSEEHLS